MGEPANRRHVSPPHAHLPVSVIPLLEELYLFLRELRCDLREGFTTIMEALDKLQAEMAREGISIDKLTVGISAAATHLADLNHQILDLSTQLAGNSAVEAKIQELAVAAAAHADAIDQATTLLEPPAVPPLDVPVDVPVDAPVA